MGTLVTIYLLGAILFQTLAFGFVALDENCKENRASWLIGIIVTGPIALILYFLTGREA
jgi:hypothetical protein